MNQLTKMLMGDDMQATERLVKVLEQVEKHLGVESNTNYDKVISYIAQAVNDRINYESQEPENTEYDLEDFDNQN